MEYLQKLKEENYKKRKKTNSKILCLKYVIIYLEVKNMFFKRTLAIRVIKAININISLYKEELRIIVKKSIDEKCELPKAEYMTIRHKYIEKIYNDVKESYKDEKDLYEKIIEIENNPGMSGYHLSTEAGFLGGNIYAIIYYAKTSMKANPLECLELAERTDNVIKETLQELYAELNN